MPSGQGGGWLWTPLPSLPCSLVWSHDRVPATEREPKCYSPFWGHEEEMGLKQ